MSIRGVVSVAGVCEGNIFDRSCRERKSTLLCGLLFANLLFTRSSPSDDELGSLLSCVDSSIINKKEWYQTDMVRLDHGTEEATRGIDRLVLGRGEELVEARTKRSSAPSELHSHLVYTWEVIGRSSTKRHVWFDRRIIKAMVVHLS